MVTLVSWKLSYSGPRGDSSPKRAHDEAYRWASSKLVPRQRKITSFESKDLYDHPLTVAKTYALKINGEGESRRKVFTVFVEGGLVETEHANGRSIVRVTPSGHALLKERRPDSYEGLWTVREQ